MLVPWTLFVPRPVLAIPASSFSPDGHSDRMKITWTQGALLATFVIILMIEVSNMEE